MVEFDSDCSIVSIPADYIGSGLTHTHKTSENCAEIDFKYIVIVHQVQIGVQTAFSRYL